MWEVTDASDVSQVVGRVNLWVEIPVLFFIPSLSLAELQNHSVSSFSSAALAQCQSSFLCFCLSFPIYLFTYLFIHSFIYLFVCLLVY